MAHIATIGLALQLVVRADEIVSCNGPLGPTMDLCVAWNGFVEIHGVIVQEDSGI